MLCAFARSAMTSRRRRSIAVAPGKAAQLDLKLQKAKDLAAQLSNGEWFMSWPGSNEIKNGLLNCTQCHSLEPIVRSKFTAAEWVPVINRMARYAQGSTQKRPQLRPGSGQGNALLRQSLMGREGEPPVQAELVQQTAEYLATINLSAGPTWSYPLKTLPRPHGAATRVVITEYDLPRPEALPHDAVVDAGWHGLVQRLRIAVPRDARSQHRQVHRVSAARSPNRARPKARSISSWTSMATSGWA